jgi:hypothetical protein
MIDLNKYYISSEFQGASEGSEGRPGFVPEALSEDTLKFLRGDGTWQEAANLSTVANYLSTSNVIISNITATGRSQFTVVDEIQTFPTIQSNTLNLVLSDSSFFVVNLNSDIFTLNFISPPPAQRALSFVLQLCASGTAFAVQWPVNVKWPAGTSPILTTTANKIDTITFITYDGGVNYFGFISALNS